MTDTITPPPQPARKEMGTMMMAIMTMPQLHSFGETLLLLTSMFIPSFVDDGGGGGGGDGGGFSFRD